MKLLCASEEIGRTLNHAPTGVDPDRIHHQCKRCQDFADASAIERRADMDDVLCADSIGFLGDTLRRFGPDQDLVLFKCVQTER
jgi:hypothetical protein